MFLKLFVRPLQRRINNRALYVADYIVAHAIRRGDRMSSTRVMDIAYLCQGWHLEQRNEPLINRDFEARRIGPVCASIRRAYAHLHEGFAEPTLRFFADPEALTEDEQSFIEEVYETAINTSPHRMRAHMDYVTPQGRIFRHETGPRDALKIGEIKHRFQQVRWLDAAQRAG